MSGISGRADKPRGLLGGIASDAFATTIAARGWRQFAAPAAFLLAASIAVAVARSTRDTTLPAPAPTHVVRSQAPATPRFYRIVKGDTLAEIAAKKHVSLARIRALNPGTSPTALFIGEKIRLR